MATDERALQIRLAAAEYLLSRILGELLARQPDPGAAGEALLASVKDDLYFAVPAYTKNPARSDDFADEVSKAAEDVVVRALKRIRNAPPARG
ncbi:MAG: hypothetical protein U1F37_08810 [Alphaproteobacteria bacterium]